MWSLLAFVGLLYGIYRYRLLFKGYENVGNKFPGKPCLPFIGNVHHLYGNSDVMYRRGYEQMLLFRRSFLVWLGPFLVFCLVTPKEIEALLSNTTSIRKARLYDPLLPWIKRGLLTSYGDKWRTHRKVLTPAFHFGILEGFLTVFNKNSNIFCQILESKASETKINVMDMVKMCALDNICEPAMGVTVNAQKNPHSDYVWAVKAMCQITYYRSVKFWLRSDTLFSLSSYGRDQKRALKIIHGYSKKVIEQRIQERKETKEEESKGNNHDQDLGVKKKRLFLDVLLDNYDCGQLTLEEVQEEVDTFMFEGHDTITSAISFSLYELGDHQDYQNRAYQEQCEIFGDDDRNPTMDDLSKMKYLEMFIKEALRLYPSVPLFGRVVEKDLKLDEECTIPAGSEAIVLSVGVHRNPDIWENPRVFDPERFTPENSAKRHPYSYIPFSAGPRNCIGMRFALIEMKSFLSKVLRKFHIKPCVPRTELQLATEVILQSATGVHVSVVMRKPQKLS